MPTVTKAANAHTVVATGWTTPSNAYATTGDNVYATTASTSKNTTISGDFGFPDFTSGDIPDGATITAVRAVGEWGFTSAITGATLGCQPRVDGANSGSEVTKTTTTEAAFTADFGTVTLADLRAASTDIKARVRSSRGNTTTASTFRLDFIALEVDYSINADGSFTATGGGVVAEVGSKGGQLALAATGGGVVVVTGEKAENEDTDREGSFAATGGGVATLAVSTERNAAVSATGSGSATVAQSTDRSEAVTATGGGVVSASVLAARMGAAAMSGGGVFTTVPTSERFVAIAATGGGVVTWTGTAGAPPEDHQGSFSATGAGAVAVSSTTDRLVALLATGGGAVAYAAATDRLASFGATGGGRATFTSSTPPPAFVVRPDAVLGLSFTTDHVEIEEVP